MRARLLVLPKFLQNGVWIPIFKVVKCALSVENYLISYDLIKTKRLKHPYFLVCYSFFNSSFCDPLDTLYVLLGKVIIVYNTNLITTCVPHHRGQNVVDSQGPVE